MREVEKKHHHRIECQCEDCCPVQPPPVPNEGPDSEDIETFDGFDIADVTVEVFKPSKRKLR